MIIEFMFRANSSTPSCGHPSMRGIFDAQHRESRRDDMIIENNVIKKIKSRRDDIVYYYIAPVGA